MLLGFLVILGLLGAVAPRVPQVSNDLQALIYACRRPIRYQAGTIDERFKLRSGELKQASKNAETIWENRSGKDLFVFDESQGITINLVFDERQQLTEQAGGIEGNIEQGKKSYNALVVKHDALVRDFQTRLKKYNEEVSYWNTHGGAPPAEFERLREEGRQLNAMVDEVNSLVEQINSLAKKLNLRVGELNKITNEFNETLTVKPEAGLYSPLEASITIYQFASRSELELTIAHELGHALGIGHLEQADALMNPQITNQTHLVQGDLDALNQVCSTPRPFTISQKILLWLKLFYERLR
ncbi:matrixin family metalloprotease [Candidatus Berkelbacteria bacterium]|nr:matrixin family metalloprotease [Candidatus Berkelbacteria bacterium]